MKFDSGITFASIVGSLAKEMDLNPAGLMGVLKTLLGKKVFFDLFVQKFKGHLKTLSKAEQVKFFEKMSGSPGDFKINYDQLNSKNIKLLKQYFEHAAKEAEGCERASAKAIVAELLPKLFKKKVAKKVEKPNTMQVALIGGLALCYYLTGKASDATLAMIDPDKVYHITIDYNDGNPKSAVHDFIVTGVGKISAPEGVYHFLECKLGESEKDFHITLKIPELGGRAGNIHKPDYWERRESIPIVGVPTISVLEVPARRRDMSNGVMDRPAFDFDGVLNRFTEDHMKEYRSRHPDNPHGWAQDVEFCGEMFEENSPEYRRLMAAAHAAATQDGRVRIVTGRRALPKEGGDPSAEFVKMLEQKIKEKFPPGQKVIFSMQQGRKIVSPRERGEDKARRAKKLGADFMLEDDSEIALGIASTGLMTLLVVDPNNARTPTRLILSDVSEEVEPRVVVTAPIGAGKSHIHAELEKTLVATGKKVIVMSSDKINAKNPRARAYDEMDRFAQENPGMVVLFDTGGTGGVPKTTTHHFVLSPGEKSSVMFAASLIGVLARSTDAECVEDKSVLTVSLDGLSPEFIEKLKEYHQGGAAAAAAPKDDAHLSLRGWLNTFKPTKSGFVELVRTLDERGHRVTIREEGDGLLKFTVFYKGPHTKDMSTNFGQQMRGPVCVLDLEKGVYEVISASMFVGPEVILFDKKQTTEDDGTVRTKALEEYIGLLQSPKGLEGTGQICLAVVKIDGKHIRVHVVPSTMDIRYLMGYRPVMGGKYLYRVMTNSSNDVSDSIRGEVALAVADLLGMEIDPSKMTATEAFFVTMDKYVAEAILPDLGNILSSLGPDLGKFGVTLSFEVAVPGSKTPWDKNPSQELAIRYDHCHFPWLGLHVNKELCFPGKGNMTGMWFPSALFDRLIKRLAIPSYFFSKDPRPVIEEYNRILTEVKDLDKAVKELNAWAKRNNVVLTEKYAHTLEGVDGFHPEGFVLFCVKEQPVEPGALLKYNMDELVLGVKGKNPIYYLLHKLSVENLGKGELGEVEKHLHLGNIFHVAGTIKAIGELDVEKLRQEIVEAYKALIEKITDNGEMVRMVGEKALPACLANPEKAFLLRSGVMTKKTGRTASPGWFAELLASALPEGNVIRSIFARDVGGEPEEWEEKRASAARLMTYFITVAPEGVTVEKISDYTKTQIRGCAYGDLIRVMSGAQ